MRAQVTYDLATHSYTLQRINIGAKPNENCIEISYEQWLECNRIRREFLDMQTWIIDMQTKRSLKWEKIKDSEKAIE